MNIDLNDLGSLIGSDFLQPKLYVWKLWEEAHMPEYASEWAACFDLKASLRIQDRVSVYREDNIKIGREVNSDGVVLYSNERMLVPTGLVFDLNEGESIRIHPRSGLSLKEGIVIANCEGVVDADYTNQTYVMLTNVSSVPFTISDGMRIAQAEVAPVYQFQIEQADHEPEEKTSRSGGFGSTGI